LIRNKRFLNILEEIENYFNLNNNESIILTNLRIIYVYPNKEVKDQNFNLNSINLNSIFYFSYEETNSKCMLKIFHYDEKTGQNLLKLINDELNNQTSPEVDMCDNGIIYYNARKKNNLCLKLLTIETSRKRNKNVLKNIYDTFISKNINKTLGIGHTGYWNTGKFTTNNY
jgi:hypothetical protein